MVSRRGLWKSKKRIAMDATINIRGGFAVDTWTTECLGTALMGEGKTTTTLFTNHYQRRRKKNKINMKTIKESIEYNLQRANAILGTNYQNWVMLSTHKGLTEDFIREFADDLDCETISTYQLLSEDFIREFADRVDWDTISANQHLSEEFIREFKDRVDWFYISEYQHLSEDFIREFKDRVHWGCISNYQNLSESFIKEFADKVNWYWISDCQRLSEDFIREFKDWVVWGNISASQHLSEDFIREFAYKVYWYRISSCQRLSEEFIREFKNRVYWGCISTYQRLSKEFIEEFKDKIYMDMVGDSWHNKSVEEKKKAVMDTGLYECHKDYFIAYKGIRANRYSNYNFQYQYLKGETYETWCDCSDEENSFGFSAWTEEKAREYCDELLVRVKVRYKDVGRVVHDGGKIRCFKIEILD